MPLAGVLLSLTNSGVIGLTVAAAGLAISFILLVLHRRRRILAALITGGHGGAVTAYPHVFVAYAGNLLRLGNILCAAYLVVQARRAPQRRLPPWQRQRQFPSRYR